MITICRNKKYKNCRPITEELRIEQKIAKKLHFAILRFARDLKYAQNSKFCIFACLILLCALENILKNTFKAHLVTSSLPRTPRPPSSPNVTRFQPPPPPPQVVIEVLNGRPLLFILHKKSSIKSRPKFLIPKYKISNQFSSIEKY